MLKQCVALGVEGAQDLLQSEMDKKQPEASEIPQQVSCNAALQSQLQQYKNAKAKVASIQRKLVADKEALDKVKAKVAEAEKQVADTQSQLDLVEAERARLEVALGSAASVAKVLSQNSAQQTANVNATGVWQALGQIASSSAAGGLPGWPPLSKETHRKPPSREDPKAKRVRLRA